MCYFLIELFPKKLAQIAWKLGEAILDTVTICTVVRPANGRNLGVAIDLSRWQA
jgi:hypothetical protein